MLENPSAQSTMAELLGQPLLKVWQDLCSAIDEKYDPDKHIIEAEENMKVVCKCFLDGGMMSEQAAEQMNVPMKFINVCMR